MMSGFRVDEKLWVSKRAAESDADKKLKGTGGNASEILSKSEEDARQSPKHSSVASTQLTDLIESQEITAVIDWISHSLEDGIVNWGELQRTQFYCEIELLWKIQSWIAFRGKDLLKSLGRIKLTILRLGMRSSMGKCLCRNCCLSG
jgi:hypothetical protein